MTSPTDIEPQADRPALLAATQPFYWSVRRELWEHRAIYIAPLAVAALSVIGFVIRLASLPQSVLAAASLPPSAQDSNLDRPYAFAAVAIVFCALIVGVFYCLGALNNERRDRSILFWKSLPVSDLITVLAKAAVPMVVLPPIVFFTVVGAQTIMLADLTAVLAKASMPLVALPLTAFVISLATQLIMLVLGSAVMLANGIAPSLIWTHWPIVPMTSAMLYSIAILTLWYAPVYGWLLLVSGWARRMPILWAVLPLLGVCIVEKIATNTTHVAALLVYRLQGFVAEGFYVPPHGKQAIDVLTILTPGRFFASPGLWLGLAAAAAFLAGAVWLRRFREPN